MFFIEEAKPGPVIQSPKLAAGANGAATLTFKTNLSVPAQVSWGPLPGRQSGGSVSLPAATSFTQTIPKFEAGHGVKVAVELDGLQARWPRWGHDTAGVRFEPRP
jgi:hypothetical protein